MKNQLVQDGLCHIGFLSLIILSFIHSEYRVINLDTAVYLFETINEPFTFYNYRIGAWIPLLILSIGVVTGVKLKLLVLLFSTIYALIPYSVFLIARYFLKTKKGTIVLLLGPLLCSSLTFYYPATEVFWGILMLTLLSLLIENDVKNRLALFSTCFLLASSHPFLIPVSLFYLGAIIIQGKINFSIILGYSLGLFLSLYMGVNSGESDYYARLHNIIDGFFFWETPPWKYLLGHTITYSQRFVPFWVVFFLVSVLTYNERLNWTKWVWAPLAMITYLILIGVVYEKGESAIILEKSILPLGAIITVLFVNYARHYKWFVFVSFLVFIYQYREMAIGIKRESERFAIIEKVTNEVNSLNNQKFLINQDHVLLANYPLKWAFSVETLLYSSLRNEKQVSICPIFDEKKFYLNNSEELFYAFPYRPIFLTHELNSNYFSLSGTYKEIK